MDQFKYLIGEYMELNTNNALLVTGEWGVGKTYYFLNELFPFIEHKNVPGSQTEKYKPLYISLFGLKKIEEYIGIFFENYIHYLIRG